MLLMPTFYMSTSKLQDFTQSSHNSETHLWHLVGLSSMYSSTSPCHPHLTSHVISVPFQLGVSQARCEARRRSPLQIAGWLPTSLPSFLFSSLSPSCLVLTTNSAWHFQRKSSPHLTSFLLSSPSSSFKLLQLTSPLQILHSPPLSFPCPSHSSFSDTTWSLVECGLEPIAKSTIIMSLSS